MTITSSNNQKLKEIRKLRMRRRERERAGRFVAEGEDLLAAADAAGWQPLERFCAAGSGLPGIEVEAKLLASASGLASGTRTLAVYAERWASSALGPLCVYLHAVHDPGNVGAVLRSAQAFGASCVVIGPGTADPFGPNAVRASMGAVFAVPVARAAAVRDLPGTRIALVPDSGPPLAELMPSLPAYRDKMATVPPGATATAGGEAAATAGGEAAGTAGGEAVVTLLIGAEREGLPDGVAAQADHTAHIQIQSHSLNAAMAATVALYEATRMAPAR